MTAYQPGGAAYPPPPTQPGALIDMAPRSNWPMVLGIIAIIFGAFGVLGGLWGLVALRVMSSMSSYPGMQQAAQIAQAPGWAAWTTIASLLGAAVAALLLAAGIGLVARRPWARSIALTWAVLKIVVVIVSTAAGYMMQRPIMEQMVQQDPNMPAFAAQAAQVGAGFGLCIGVAWGWALPIVMLIWLLRAPIREEMAGWR